jgi:hypothetical protein
MPISVGLFEVHDKIEFSMVGKLQILLQNFDIMHCVVAFVKDENNNLTSMAITLCSIVDCHPLKFLWVYEGTYFGHVMSRTCQYGSNDERMVTSLKHVNVKNAQVNLQMTITWTKKLRKGR